MIIMYDLDDNILMTFEGYKECADYFQITRHALRCHICRSRKGKINKKRDIKRKRWVKLYKEEK